MDAARPPAGSGDLRKLRHFVAVAEARNFTRAAERLHLAQQAVSGSVARLEQELGTPLFSRTTRRVELTAAGRSLFASAPAVLAAYDAAWHEARRAGRQDGDGAVLRVGRTPALTGHEVLQLLGPLRDARPDLAVSVVQHWPDELAGHLRDGDLHLAFARALARTPGIESRPVRGHGQRLAIALHPDDELAGESALELRRLARHALVLWGPPDRSAYAQHLLDLCHVAGLDPVVRVTTTQGAAPVLAVERPGEFAFVTDRPGDLEGRRVVELVDEVLAPVRLLMRSGTRSAAVEAAVDALRP